MSRINRFSTVYIDSEDRIRLTGESEEGNVLGCMLTLRLLRRLIPHLVKILAPEDDQAPVSTALSTAAGDTTQKRSASNELSQGIAQLRAQAGIKPETPVTLPAEDTAWLAHAVDIAANEQQVILTFRDSGELQIQLQLNAVQLRQWLGILFHLWAKAEWPTEVWPEWIETEALASPEKGSVVH